MKILPLDNVSSPATRLSKVDLPQPEGPTERRIRLVEFDVHALDDFSRPELLYFSLVDIGIALTFQSISGETPDEIFPSDDVNQ
jgi:hypothetical protein